MVIGVCTVELHLPAARSLKDKRSILKSVLRRIRNEFNVSIAEVGHHDSWHSAQIGIATVSTDAGHAHGRLTHVVNWIERTRLDVDLVDYQIEML